MVKGCPKACDTSRLNLANYNLNLGDYGLFLMVGSLVALVSCYALMSSWLSLHVVPHHATVYIKNDPSNFMKFKTQW